MKCVVYVGTGEPKTVEYRLGDAIVIHNRTDGMADCLIETSAEGITIYLRGKETGRGSVLAAEKPYRATRPNR